MARLSRPTKPEEKMMKKLQYYVIKGSGKKHAGRGYLTALK